MNVKRIIKKTVEFPIALDRWAGPVHGMSKAEKSTNDWLLYTMFAR